MYACPREQVFTQLRFHCNRKLPCKDTIIVVRSSCGLVMDYIVSEKPYNCRVREF